MRIFDTILFAIMYGVSMWNQDYNAAFPWGILVLVFLENRRVAAKGAK